MAEPKARLIESVPSSFAKNASAPQARAFAQVVVADVIEQVFTDKLSAVGVVHGREGLTMDKNAKSLLADTVNVHLVEQDVSRTIVASNGMKSSVGHEMSTDRPSGGAAQDVRAVVEQHAAAQEQVLASLAVDGQGNTVHKMVVGERMNIVEKKVVVEDALTVGKGPTLGRESLAPANVPRTEKHSESHDAAFADESKLTAQHQAHPRPQDSVPSSMRNGNLAEQRSSVRDPTVQEQFGIEPVFRPMLPTADSASRQVVESGELAEEGRVYESGETNQGGRKRKVAETESAKGEDKSEIAAMAVPSAEKVKPSSAGEAKAVGPAKRARAPNVPSDELSKSTHHEPVLEQACKAFSGRVDLSAYCGHRIVAYVDGQELAGWVLDVEVPNIEQEARFEEPKQKVGILGSKDEGDEVGYARRRSKKVPVPRKPRRCGPLSAHRADVTIAPEERNRFLNVIPIASSDVQARSVIVIGAGIAGIAAARALTDRGFVVTILEGRGRIGGRIATDWSMGCPVDLGASFIHGADGNPLTEIAREAGLLTYSPRDVDTLIYANGTRVTRDLDKRAEEIWKELLARAGRIAKGPTLNLPSLDIGLGKLLNRLKSELKGGCSEDVDLLLAWHAANLEMACASELPDLSAKHYDMDTGFGFSGSHRLLREGYASMVHALGRNLDIRLDTPVIAVQRDVPVQVQLGEKRSTKKEVSALGLKTRQEGLAAEGSADVLRDRNVRHLGHSRMPWRPSPSAESLITESTRQSAAVRVIAQDGQEFLAESCIVTLPLGVLQSGDVEFVPPLPPWKHDAIHNIGFGLVNKVILRFEDPFWIDSLPKHPGDDEHLEGGPDYIGRVSAEQGIFYLFLSLQRCIGAPILVAISSGKFAEHIETRSDEEVVGMAMQALTEMFPRKRVSKLLAHTVTRWKSDKFARGSYSFAQVGTTPDDYSHISAGLGNLCFAGEATHRNHPATAHGAYMSGIREAGRVIEGSGIAEADRRRYARELALLQEPQPLSSQRDAGTAGHGGHYALPAKTRPLSVPSSEKRSAAMSTGRTRRRMRRSEG